MIIVMQAGAETQNVERVISEVEALGYRAHPIYGTDRTVIACLGDERGKERIQILDSLPEVERVVPILKPFKLASQEVHREPTVVDVDGVEVGGKEFVLMAGPCAVESREQILETAHAVKEAGAKILRGGAFKPRTSPYSFQGLAEKGLKYLAEAREATGLRVVSELVDTHHLEMVQEYVDLIQIGARNSHNFFLLSNLGQAQKPILLKRGMMSTIEEYLMAAEYVLSNGNGQVILCERGIRTFETYTRNTLDLNAVVALKKLSHLPVVVDPSHGTGRWDLVAPVSFASLAAGADGLLVEVHPHPDLAVSDGPQSLRPERFGKMVKKLREFAAVAGRTLEGITNP